jgi:hypothetical protein
MTTRQVAIKSTRTGNFLGGLPIRCCPVNPIQNGDLHHSAEFAGLVPCSKRDERLYQYDSNFGNARLVPHLQIRPGFRSLRNRDSLRP